MTTMIIEDDDDDDDDDDKDDEDVGGVPVHNPAELDRCMTSSRGGRTPDDSWVISHLNDCDNDYEDDADGDEKGSYWTSA